MNVISHTFSNRLWLVILIAVLEMLIMVLWIVMKKVERELNSR